MFLKKLIIFLSIFIALPLLSFADSNGIWVDASDIVSGTFGSDEGLGTFTFTSDLIYKGLEIDNRFINVNEVDSITSNMVVDGTLTSSDVSFTYAGSFSKGGIATNSLLLNGANWNSAPAITTPYLIDSDNSVYGLNPSASSYVNILTANQIESTVGGSIIIKLN